VSAPLWERLKSLFKSNTKAKAGETRYNLDRQDERHWAERATMAADLLAIASKSTPIRTVADIGCGSGKIGGFLSLLGLSVEYSGFDLVPQAGNVRQFDITRDSLPKRFDAVMLLGVLEYVDDAKVALQRVRPYTGLLIVTHAVKETRTGVTAKKQRKLGWLTFLTSEEFERVIVAAGFTVEKSALTPDQRTRVWVCR
jgi:2-polyprenyl-3-methyl-5-hydroxy-6-metoxy-1,4-benzoquinol methylase